VLRSELMECASRGRICGRDMDAAAEALGQDCAMAAGPPLRVDYSPVPVRKWPCSAFSDRGASVASGSKREAHGVLISPQRRCQNDGFQSMLFIPANAGILPRPPTSLSRSSGTDRTAGDGRHTYFPPFSPAPRLDMRDSFGQPKARWTHGRRDEFLFLA
jgi:hypothetical protein